MLVVANADVNWLIFLKQFVPYFSVHQILVPSLSGIFQVIYFQWPLPACPLVCTPSVLSSCFWALPLRRLTAVLCAYLWRVDCVTRHECDESTGDELTMWWDDRVTTWLCGELTGSLSLVLRYTFVTCLVWSVVFIYCLLYFCCWKANDKILATSILS